MALSRREQLLLEDAKRRNSFLNSLSQERPAEITQPQERGTGFLDKPIVDTVGETLENLGNKFSRGMDARRNGTVRQEVTSKPVERGVLKNLGNTNISEPVMMSGHNKLSSPRINEISNARRDSDLGKMTSSSRALANGGQENTFNIGGNSLSYKLSDRDLALKKNIEAIDDRIAAGFVPTPEQAERIADIKRQAGFTRGGTDRGISRSNTYQRGNLDIQFDDPVDPAARARFLENPVRPTAQIDRYNNTYGNQTGPSLGQLASRNADRVINRRPKPNPRGWQARLALDKQKLQNEQAERNLSATIKSKQNIAADDNALARERNDILRENNLLQSQKTPKPQILTETDVLGNKTQRIMVPNEEGKYVDATAENANQFETPSTATKALMMKKKGDKKYEDEYVKRFGQLPY